MNTNTMTGHCLCGAVTIKTATTQTLEACHCTMCLRWGSGPLMAIVCDANAQVEVTGQEHVALFNSSEWAERAFCNTCGSHLFYRFKDSHAYLLLAGLFQAQTDFEIKEQIFIDHKANYYDLANNTLKLTEAQVLEKYAIT